MSGEIFSDDIFKVDTWEKNIGERLDIVCSIEKLEKIRDLYFNFIFQFLEDYSDVAIDETKGEIRKIYGKFKVGEVERIKGFFKGSLRYATFEISGFNCEDFDMDEGSWITPGELEREVRNGLQKQ